MSSCQIRSILEKGKVSSPLNYSKVTKEISEVPSLDKSVDPRPDFGRLREESGTETEGTLYGKRRQFTEGTKRTNCPTKTLRIVKSFFVL